MKLRIIAAHRGSLKGGDWRRVYRLQYGVWFLWFTIEDFKTAETAINRASMLANFDEIILKKNFF